MKKSAAGHILIYRNSQKINGDNEGVSKVSRPLFLDTIRTHHPVLLVNRIIDQIDLSVLEKQYQGGGASSYHPRMLLKVVVYAY